MARTRADGDRTRERILEVSLPLFAAHGYAGTSVRTVAAAAGVNVATLAYHFSDKEGLYETVVQRLHVDLAEGFPTEVSGETPGEQVRAWMRAGVAFVAERREHVRLLIRHVLDHGALPDVVVDRWSEQLLSRAEALVALFRPDWPPTRRRLLVLSMMHLTVRLMIEDRQQLARMSGVPVERLDEELVDWLSSMLQRELGLPDRP
jgi:AcrR family transcriptional regulator